MTKVRYIPQLHSKPLNYLQICGAVGKEVGTSAWKLLVAGPDKVGYVNQHGLSRKHIVAGVKASLKRLQLDYIDVLQCAPLFVLLVARCVC